MDYDRRGQLTRLEAKLDRLGEKVENINVALGEIRGARKAIYGMAAVFGAVAGMLASFFAGAWRRP